MNQVRNTSDEDFHGEFDEKLFHDLKADNIFDPDINQNIPNMKGGRHGAGQLMSTKMVADSMRNLLKFSREKTESANNHFHAFDDYLVR